MTALTFAVVFLGLAFLALCFGFIVLARQIGVIYERIAPMGALMNDSGPKVGEQSPKFALESLNGGTVSIGAPQDKATLVFFVSPTCPICKSLLPSLRSLARSYRRDLDVVYVSDGDAASQQTLVREHGLEDATYVVGPEIGMTYQIGKLPYAVLIDADGVLRAKGLVNNREHLESLFEAQSMGVGSLQEYMHGQKRAAH